MTDERVPSVRAANPRASAEGSRFSGRLIRVGIVAIAFIGLLALLFSFAPTYLARHLVASALDSRGVEHEGIETLRVNPWTLELWAGPLRFGVGSANRARMGEVGLNIRFYPLLKRRVSFERLLLREIDLNVTRSDETGYLVNGIALSHVIPPLGMAQASEGSGEVWEAGVDTLELLDSRLDLRNNDNAELVVDVDRLALLGFNTWESEQPGQFDISARLNDIRLHWSGEARPFADDIALSLDARMEQVTVAKLARLTGPWGLDRHEGTWDAHITSSLSLLGSGGLQGHANGTVDLDSADYARAGDFALALEKATVHLDVGYALSQSGDLALQGRVSLDLGPNRSAFGDKTKLTAAGGRVSVNELDARYSADGTLQVAGAPTVDVKSIELSGPIEVSADKLLELLVFLQSLSTTQTVSAADTGLGGISGRSVVLPSSDVKFGRLAAEFHTLDLRSVDGRVELGLTASADLADTVILANQRHIAVERWHALLDQFSATSGQGRLAVVTGGRSSLGVAAAKSGRGEMKLGELEVEVSQLDLEATADGVSVKLASAGRAGGFSGLAYAKQALPQLQVKVGAARLALPLASLEAQRGSFRWQASGDAAARSLTANFADGRAAALKLKRAEVSALRAREPLRLSADALTMEDVDLDLTRSLFLALVRGGKAAPQRAAIATEVASGPNAEAPSSTPATAEGEMDVHRVQSLLTKLGYNPGPVDGRMGRRTNAAISAFQRREGLDVDGRLSSPLLMALEARAEMPDNADVTGPTRKKIKGAAGFGVRIGRVTLTGSPVFRFRDDIITPNLTIETVFKELEVQGLDTEETDERTRLNAIANVDELTHVSVSGWVGKLAENADLDMKAEVKNLRLSTYSPYAAELAGAHLESGRLDAAAEVKATRGRLGGEIRLDAADIRLRPVGSADAERIAKTVGAPLEEAIDLLTDQDGRIVLTLPISGTLSSPDVDIGPAVNRAIGNVLESVFPPTLIASMLEGLVEGSGPTFEPVEFAPGSSELVKVGKGYLDSLAKLLAEHPDLSLKVCGRSTMVDMNAVAPTARMHRHREADARGLFGETNGAAVRQYTPAETALTKLAVERERNVRRYLVTEKGIDAARISECRSTFEAADRGIPRVELSL